MMHDYMYSVYETCLFMAESDPERRPGLCSSSLDPVNVNVGTMLVLPRHVVVNAVTARLLTLITVVCRVDDHEKATCHDVTSFLNVSITQPGSSDEDCKAQMVQYG